jgi:flagellar biosynthesis/type III secretory pathway M-ring protein FliF/YscJ
MAKPREAEKSAAGGAGAGQLAGEHGGDGAAGEGQTPADSYAEILDKVRNYAKSDPKVTADIVKEWMAKE